MSHPRDVFTHKQPSALVRATLATANTLLSSDRWFSPLDEAELRRAAEARTGLSDWGDDFSEDAFQAIVRSGREDARLNFIGRYSLRKAVVGALSNWLRLVDQRKAHPDAMARPVRKPIIIAGPPRTGTTLLHHLMCNHPDAIFMPMWWAMRPLAAPTADEWAAGGSAERRKQAERAATLMDHFVPAMKEIHPYATDLPVECSYLVAPAFISNQWGAWPLYSYLDWARKADTTGAYRCYEQHLKLMQQHMPGDHWILKSPGHFLGLGQLMQAMPDATLVVTHRDPAKFFASLNSMMSAHQTVMSDDLDYRRMSDILIDTFHDAAMRYVELREQHPDRFIDVCFRELMADPAATAKRIYETAGVRWDDEVAAALDGFLERRKEGRQHDHRYPQEQFGMSPDMLRERFQEYIDVANIKVG